MEARIWPANDGGHIVKGINNEKPMEETCSDPNTCGEHSDDLYVR